MVGKFDSSKVVMFCPGFVNFKIAALEKGKKTQYAAFYSLESRLKIIIDLNNFLRFLLRRKLTFITYSMGNSLQLFSVNF